MSLEPRKPPLVGGEETPHSLMSHRTPGSEEWILPRLLQEPAECLWGVQPCCAVGALENGS